MADSRAMWFRFALLIGLLCGSTPAARAQTWTVCIDPASGGLTPEGFRSVREVAAAASASRYGFLNYRIRRSSLGRQGEPPSPRIVDLELRRARAQGWSLWSAELPYDGLPSGDRHCFEILAEEGGPGLWHYWGPYFPLGSAIIPEAQKPNLEYLVVGYEPGNTLFLLEGFSDTLGSTDANARLAARRVDAVARELVRLGVRWDDIQQRSIGETLLARPTADGVAEPLNRRVNINVRTRPPPGR